VRRPKLSNNESAVPEEGEEDGIHNTTFEVVI
jgi:hypothetical protein